MSALPSAIAVLIVSFGKGAGFCAGVIEWSPVSARKFGRPADRP
jgi:hypothetical protein